MSSKNIAKINFQIVADIKKELRLQGHYLTGDLERSFIERQSNTDNQIYLEAYAAGFLEELERGVPADEIKPLDKSSAEFKALAVWVRKRGLQDKGERYNSPGSIAEAIWRKWQRLGKPSESSKEFSKTGEILGAVETVFKRKTADVFQEIDKEAVLQIDKTFFE